MTKAIRKVVNPEIRLHGKLTAEYAAWLHMKQRCSNPKSTGYKNYGGRGITVCSEWFKSFKNFRLALGSRPTSAHMLERIDNHGNYEPGNVKWALPIVQANNTRRNIFTEYEGESITLAQLARRTGIAYLTLVARHSRGLEDEELIDPPMKPRGKAPKWGLPA